MIVLILRSACLGAAMLALSVAAFAQEAVLTGAVTDATGGVLPGVTVTALHAASGNRFIAVTDERGIYRIPARVGQYILRAELDGFQATERSGIDLLVGQTATIALQLSVGGVTDAVTVTGEAPLIDVTTSTLGGNIDPKQVQELPVQGRNWLALAMLAPGSRMTSDTSNTPIANRGAAGDVRQYQFSLDGQQVTSEMGFGNQPRYSQESIGEFQFISNRFDATMGRSAAVQVIAITKSGTNRYSGSVRGNFRDSRLNAPNPVLNRVVPIDNRQLAFTLGGPVVKDRLHFFSHFEYEAEPRESVWNTPFPAFNISLTGDETIKMGGGRADYQLSPTTRLMGKVTTATRWQPFTPGDQSHPAATGSTREINREYIGQMTQVLSNRAVNEIKVGKTRWIFRNANLTSWSNHWQSASGVTTGSPRITFSNFTIGGNQFYPRHGAQDNWSIRDDFTFSYDWKGRHDMKVGGDAVVIVDDGNNCQACMGVVDARGGTPTAAQLQAWFPDPFNADTWNMAAISPLVRTYSIGVGNYATHDVRPQYGAWFQDDWRLSSNLTLNLGARYDLSLNGNGNNYAVPPFVDAGRPADRNNIQPRVGFAYQLGTDTVIRGGSGLYYSTPLQIDTYFMAQIDRLVVIQYTNDGRPDFGSNPTNGQPLPDVATGQQQFCHIRNVPGCLRRTLQELMAPEEYSTSLGRTWQNSFGFQHQIGNTMSVEADYVYNQGRNEKDVISNMNLTFNPATGTNYPFSDISRRAYPDWGAISMVTRMGRSSYHALQTAVRKRFGDRWQGAATYTWSGLWDAFPPAFTGIQPVTFETAPDLGNEWSLSSGDLRHRAVLNGIWTVGKGLQVSGVVYTGIGERATTTYGGDVRVISGVGGSESSSRLRARPDGSIVPRNWFVQPPRRKVDFRVQQSIPLPRGMRLEGIAEVFNVFNSPNWTINTVETSPQYLQQIAGQNRTAQVGFRLTY
jgi:hypothetical protein